MAARGTKKIPTRAATFVAQTDVGLGIAREGSNLLAWGLNTTGRLGLGHASTVNSPQPVLGGLKVSKFVTFATGTATTTILDTNSYAWAWGNGGSGRLGNNNSNNQSSPVSVVGGRQWRDIFATSTFIFALDNLSYAYAWGLNSQGQLGVNSTNSVSSPTSVVGGRRWQAIYPAVGTVTTVALDSLSYAYAWGQGDSGQLGNGATNSQSSPVSVVGGRQWRHVSSTGFTVIALDSLSYAWAWGQGGSGQRGDNTTTFTAASPVSVVGARRWQTISSASAYAVGLDNLSYAWAWGGAVNGAIGDNTSGASRSSPVSVVGGKQWREIRAHDQLFTLALDNLSYAWAWGRNTQGALGDGTTTDRLSPVSVVGGRQFVKLLRQETSDSNLVAGAIDASGQIWMWGALSQLGDGTDQNRSSPVSVRKILPAKVFG